MSLSLPKELVEKLSLQETPEQLGNNVDSIALREEFVGAVKHVNEKPAASMFPEDVQRRLFGLFMLAQRGVPPPTKSGNMEDAHIDAWAEAFSTYSSLSGDELVRSAMQEYVELVEANDPSFLFDDEEEELASASSRAANDAPMVSSIFDAARTSTDLAPFLPAQANAIDNDSLSVLHHAVDAENLTAVKALLAANASPNVFDSTHSTPLHYASMLGSTEIVQVLLSSGSDPTHKDEDGKTPATLATSEGHQEITRILLTAMVQPAKAQGLLPGRLPIIDFADWLHGGPEARAAIARSFDQAFTEWGFCQIRRYEEIIPEAMIREAREQASHFFALPAESKSKYRVDGVVGYLAVGEESVADTNADANSVDAEGARRAGAADPVESLNLPAYQEEGTQWSAARAEIECPWKGASYIPLEPAGFRDAALAYFGGMTKLMEELMRLAETALGLPANYFHAAFEHPGTLLRMAYYPPSEAPPPGGQARQAHRYGEHTDFDGFTILQREGDGSSSDNTGGEAADTGGLEIELKDGSWAAVPSLPGTLTINIGDLFARWTNDRWRATKHRVVSPRLGPSRARLSLVYFTGPHPDTVVSCLPCPKCRRELPKYDEIKARDHVNMKMQAATASARAQAEGGHLV